MHPRVGHRPSRLPAIKPGGALQNDGISRWIASSRPLLAMTVRISLSGSASQDDGKQCMRVCKAQVPRERFVIASASEAIQAEISRWIASSRPLLAMTARISENGFLDQRDHEQTQETRTTRALQQASRAGRTGGAARSRVRCDPAIVRRGVAAMEFLRARFLPAAQAMRRQGRIGLFAARMAAAAAGGADAGASRGHRRRTAPGAGSVAHRMGFAPLPAVEFCLMLDAARGVIRDARRDPVAWFPTFRFPSELICSLVTTKPCQIQRMAEARPDSPATRRA
jgi:hypothetical protein